MKADEAVRDMFENRLAKADLKALARSRGFSEEHVAAPELVEHAFLSDLGVEKALATLEPVEILLLNHLVCIGEEVGIEIFERIYGPDGKEEREELRWQSFSERYKPVLQRVQSSLVRKGVLVVAEEKDTFSKQALLERLRFLFPVGFAPFLPLPFRPIRLERDTAGDYRGDFLRGKLQEVLQAQEAAAGRKDKAARLGIEDGELVLGGKPFSAKRLSKWQADEWEAACPAGSKKGPLPFLSLVGCTLYALTRLGEDEAAAPVDLVPFWKLAYPGAKLPDAGSFFEAGWQRGCLEMVSAAGKTLYRLPRSSTSLPRASTGSTEAAAARPEEYLDTRDSSAVVIDLEKVPLIALEQIAGIARLEARGGRLLAHPSFLKLSRASDEARRDPLLSWLQEHHKGFGGVLQAISGRKGKTFVHEGLLIARIKDLGLKLTIEKKLSDRGRIVTLSDELIAFPRDALGDVLPLVKKAGYVIKMVNADGKP